MVFNREKLFYCFKNIWQKSGKLSVHIFSMYKSFNIWLWSKYWTKPPKTIPAYFKDLRYFYRKYFHKNPRKIQQVTNAYCDDLAKPHVNQSAPKPFLSRTKFEQLYIGNFLLLISTFVYMFTWPNEATTSSGASRRSDFIN